MTNNRKAILRLIAHKNRILGDLLKLKKHLIWLSDEIELLETDCGANTED